MPRRIVEIELGLCCLVLFGTASVADDEMVVDLSEPAIQQVAVQPQFAPPGGNPQYAPAPSSTTTQGLLEPTPSQYFPESDDPESAYPEPGYPAAGPVPADEDPGFFGWRPQPRHYDLPSRSFSLFRSPASYGWAYHERCAPTPWKPRGDGIPRRTSCYRMDYAPYHLEHDDSKHGPAFYMRYELYPCEECHAHGRHLRRYYGPRY